jgi:putative heme-binding domain-containing protein
VNRNSWIHAICVLACVATSLAAQDDPYARFMAKTEALTPQEQQRRFRLPAGFAIDLVAAEPAIRKPINLAFDSAGRLLVSGSVEYPHPVPPGGTPRDAIYRLTDTGGDGTFDHTAVFVAGLNLPMGVAAVPSGVIVSSVGTVDEFRDGGFRHGEFRHGAGDRRREAGGSLRRDGGSLRRTVLRGFGYDDTHGMVSSLTPWIDGWIYATHGEGNTSRVAGADGHAVTLRGGNAFRFRRDGSRVEIFAHGQANPFGLAVDPRGDLFSADSHSRPAMLLLRGGWYAGIGAKHDGLGLAPVIMDHYHGSTGIAGIAFYADDVYPPPYRETLFIGNPSTGRINQDALESRGSSYRTVERPDFLACDDPWFRPVDIKLGPDGGLYIADFYDRVIAHNVVPTGHAGRDRQRGRIWRVRYTGKREARPVRDLSRAELPELLKALAHANLTVRTLATNEIVERVGRDAVGALKSLVLKALMTGESRPHERACALWALARLRSLDAGLIDRLARDADPVVRTQLVKALGEMPDWTGQSAGLFELVRDKLRDTDPFVRRAAADALGRHPSQGNLRPLVDAWTAAAIGDALLIHTIRMAVRDNLGAVEDVPRAAAAAMAGLASDSPHERLLAGACLGLPTASSARFLLSHLQGKDHDASQRATLLHHAAKHLPRDEMPELYSFVRSFRRHETETQGEILRAVFRAAQERESAVPNDIAQWAIEHARRLLESGDEFSVQAGIESAWTMRLKPLAGQIKPLAERKSPYPELRSLAIDAVAALEPAESIGFLGGLLADAAEPAEIREKAADALAKIPDVRGRKILLAELHNAPFALALAIARQLIHTPDAAESLLVAIGQGRAPRQLLLDPQLDQLLRDSGLPNIDARLADLRRGLPPVDDRAEKEIARHRVAFGQARPDARRGGEVFEKQCAACHAIGGRGAEIGPSLDGVAARGLDRLLEDLLIPSLSLDPKFRATLVVMKDGTTRTGLVVSDEPAALVLADAEGKETRLPIAQVESKKPLNVSPMPPASRIAEGDLYDLVAYLLAHKQQPK